MCPGEQITQTCPPWVGVGRNRGTQSPAHQRAGRGEVEGTEWLAGAPGVLVSPVSFYRSGVGLTGSSQTMFYAEVTDAQRSGTGGGLAEEGELIEVVHLPLDGAQAFADNSDVPKTLGVIFAISWFFSQVAPCLDLH